jgi:hypothetical protein
MAAHGAAKYLARLRSLEVGSHHQHPYGEIVLYENIWRYLMKSRRVPKSHTPSAPTSRINQP